MTMNNNSEAKTGQHKYNLIFTWVVIFALLATGWQSMKQGYSQISEQFFMRDYLIQHYNQMRMDIGDRVFPPYVIVGPDGWLQHTFTDNIDDFQKIIPLPEARIRSFNKYMSLADVYGRKNNIQILIVVAPSKTTIYPDKLPSQIVPIGQTSRLDQMLESVSTYSNIQILDLRSILIAARKEQDVYFITDSHWNQQGAYIAYSEVINSLSEKYPELQSYPLDAIPFTESYITRDLSRIINAGHIPEKSMVREKLPDFVKSQQFQDHFGYHESTWIPGSTAPVALVYHDSFGYTNLNDYLLLNFSKAYFIHHQSEKLINPQTVERFQPNIIIIEIVEWDLRALSGILSALITE